jgi:hypothetical protein
MREKEPNQPDPKKEDKYFEKIIMKAMKEIKERKDPPINIVRVFNKFAFAMFALESKKQENNLINLDGAIFSMDYVYKLDAKGNLEKVAVNTARDILKVCIEEIEKHISELPEKERKEAEKLLPIAKIYLAGA